MFFTLFIASPSSPLRVLICAAGWVLQPRARCVWMFSIATVASSTSMPTASASPPSVMRWIVCPVIHSAKHAAEQRERDVYHHDEGAPPVAQEQSTIRPVSTAPSAPSLTMS